MITVTTTASDKLKQILEEQGQQGGALRVVAVPQGHGLQYMLGFEDGPKEDDIVVSQDGIQVLLDADSAPLMEGSEIDYVEDLMRSGFTIANPNFSGGGCGSGGCGNCDCGSH